MMGPMPGTMKVATAAPIGMPTDAPAAAPVTAPIAVPIPGCSPSSVGTRLIARSEPGVSRVIASSRTPLSRRRPNARAASSRVAKSPETISMVGPPPRGVLHPLGQRLACYPRTPMPLPIHLSLPPDAARARDEARRLVESELQSNDRAVEETGQIPATAVECLRRAGFFGLNTPCEYGGRGLDMLATCAAIAELARAHIAYYYVAGVNVHLASKGIELDGSDAQRRRWLPELASGRMIGAFALTEAEAGSDAAGLRTTAVRDGPHFVLNGRKRYITNAPIADLFTVFAATEPERGARGITAFAVPRGTPGVEIGAINRMAGGHGSLHSEVVFTDCRVPADHVVGAPGAGFRTAMRCLNAGRVIWSAYSVGAAELLLELAVGHLTTRRQFGRPLADNQGLQWQLADMAADLHAARLVTHDAAVRYDREPGRRPEVGAMAKLVAGEMAFRVADRAMQLFGGAGYSKDLPIERIWRDVRVIRILDGTSEILRSIVARHVLASAPGDPALGVQ